MKTYIITRHPATVEYLKEVFSYDAEIIIHADDNFFASLKENDTVIGILPAPLMTRVCKITNKPFYHFEINLPPELRGKELSLHDLAILSPKVKKYWIQEV